MTLPRDDQRSAVQIVRECYSSLPELRAIIQLIPSIGGSIDTLICGRMGQIEAARIEDFVRKLSARLSGMEKSMANLRDEGFADLVRSTFEKVARTRSSDKRSRFASILARQVEMPAEWEEAESATRLLADLQDIHLAVLNIALTAPRIEKPFDGQRLVSPVTSREQVKSEIDPTTSSPVFLPPALPAYKPMAIRMACIDLMSRGLLNDDGVGRWGTMPMEFLSPTDLADWFAAWVQIKGKNPQ